MDLHVSILVFLAMGVSCQSDEPGTVFSPTTTTEVVSTGPPLPADTVLITEIMYHPVLEEDYVDNHEFVEIHNPGSVAIALDGWRLEGTGTDFGADTVIQPGGFLVVAKNPTALLEVPLYGLSADQVIGPFDGQLDNDGETLKVVRPDKSISDEVDFTDAFPWPIAADALGAGENWLPAHVLPLTSHRYTGISLERVSLATAGSDPANWVASDIDAPSPGAAFSGLREMPKPILESLEATALDGGVIGADDPVELSLVFSGLGDLSNATVEYFVDDLRVENETVEVLDIDDADLEDRQVTVTVPTLPSESIVRYRVLADRGDGQEVVSPRATDPYTHHAYFVDPEVVTNSRLYQLYVAPAAWTRMWDNLDEGRENGCDASIPWNEKVPGVFVFEGHVYDVRVRYQGSRYNRKNGAALANWPYPGPTEPAPLTGLSWRIGFPRYDRFEGRKAFSLSKLTQGCPGLTAGVGFEMFRQAGLPAATTRYIRFHVNGGYYRYMLEIERPGEGMMEAWHEQVAAAEGLDEAEPVGHLYKSVGLNGDAGPFGWGDARPLAASCGHSAYDRYTYTYDRKTYTWETHEDLIQMIEDLDAFRAPNGTVDIPGTQAYLAANFDVESMLDHLAVMNYSVPFDDYFQNHFLYQRDDGRWLLLAWDIDLNWGEWAGQSGGGAQASIFGGKNGDIVIGGIGANRSGWWNRIKDSFLVAYEDEFIVRIKDLNETVLHPSNIALAIANVEAAYNASEAALAASAPTCDMSSEAAAFQTFADDRYDYIRNTDAADLVD
jgi:hypothetical protein